VRHFSKVSDGKKAHEQVGIVGDERQAAKQPKKKPRPKAGGGQVIGGHPLVISAPPEPDQKAASEGGMGVGHERQEIHVNGQPRSEPESQSRPKGDPLVKKLPCHRERKEQAQKTIKGSAQCAKVTVRQGETVLRDGGVGERKGVVEGSEGMGSQEKGRPQKRRTDGKLVFHEPRGGVKVRLQPPLRIKVVAVMQRVGVAILILKVKVVVNNQ